jgi:hypothetical protein
MILNLEFKKTKNSKFVLLFMVQKPLLFKKIYETCKEMHFEFLFLQFCLFGSHEYNKGTKTTLKHCIR